MAMARFSISFTVIQVEEAGTAEEAVAVAANAIVDKYGVALVEDAVIRAELLVPKDQKEPVGLDWDEYLKMMMLEGRYDE
jgi:hypothetical protein